jgi:hypothetical protein
MDVLREDIAQAFEGPLAEVNGLPTGVLYAVVLTIAHAAGKQVRSAVVDALRPLLGEPSGTRDGWFGGLLRYTGTLPAVVSWRKHAVTVEVGRRLRSSKVEDLVRALADIPGASDLRVSAHRRVFSEPGSRQAGPLE